MPAADPLTELDSAEALDPPVSAGRRFFTELLRSPKGLTGFVLILLVVLVAIFAPLLAPHDPARQTLSLRFQPPACAEDGSKSNRQ